MMIKKINAVCFLICFSYTILVILPTLRESGFGFLQASDLLNNTNATATNNIQTAGPVQFASPHTKAITDGKSIIIDLQIQPFPVTKNVNTHFKISFFQPSGDIQQHIDYDVVIKEFNKEIFNASGLTGQPLLHTGEGGVTIPYKFDHSGKFVLEVDVFGLGLPSIPIKTERVLFDLDVS